MINQTISHYKILEKLGEDGMGEVYLAEDTKLDRKVALKFLPPQYTSDADLNKRFQREAKAAAALNHPNIVTVHEIGEHEGRAYIAMEYVQGESLRVKVKSGPLAMDSAVDIALQICEGLNAAHQAGIIHRDIKPENVIVDKSGRVRILDFGLARMAGGSKLTKEATTLGTISYMSPEQFRGEPVDHRADIWAVGVVLYEMLTAVLPFRGEYEQAVMYMVLNVEPEPVEKLRPDIPSALRDILDKTLEKAAKDRYQSVEHLLADLKKLRKNLESGGSAAQAVRRPAGMRKRIPKSVIFAAVLVLVVAILTIGYRLFQQEISTPKIVQVHALTTTTAVEEVSPLLSPDGTKVAYASDEDGKFDLCVRQLASGQTMNLARDEKGSVRAYAWSPDGNWIAYISARNGGGIYVTSDYGGTVRRVAAHNYEDFWGLNWSPDGKKLVYTVNEKLYMVLASGGVPEPIPCPQNVLDPAWSPDGQRIVLTSGALWSSARQQNSRQRIWSIRPDGSDAIAVTDSSRRLFSPFWAHDGKRIFFKWDRGGVRDIWWVPVDKNGKPTGSAKPLTAGSDAYYFSLSNDGAKLAYGTGGNNVNIWSLALGTDRVLTMDDAVQITHENNVIWNLAMSPDHEWMAFASSREGRNAIWLARKDGQALRQLTTDDSSNHLSPSWSPDGSRIAFSSDQTGNMDIYTMPVDGGPATTLSANSAEVDAFPSWSPDGKRIVFNSDRSGNYDMWETSVGSGKTRQLTDHQAGDGAPRYSPDGRFISFISNREGAWDLYLLPAGGGEPTQLTHVGAPEFIGHVWSPDSKTIYLRHYDPGKGDPKVHIQAVSVPDGSMHKVLDLDNIGGEAIVASMATDGEKLYFIVRRPIGDIWLAELAYE